MMVDLLESQGEASLVLEFANERCAFLENQERCI